MWAKHCKLPPPSYKAERQTLVAFLFALKTPMCVSAAPVFEHNTKNQSDHAW